MALKNTTEKKEEKKSKKKISVLKPFKDVVSGDILDRGMVEKNLPFLLFVTGLMLVYIGYQYYVDNSVREQVKVEKEGAELYSKLQSAKERFNERSLQSKVAKEVSVIGMFESVDPPIAIPVKEGEIIE